jgi:hypothetical protein
MSDRKLSIEIREVEQLEKVLKTLDGIAHMIQGGEAEPRSNILLASLATLSFHHPTREIIVGVGCISISGSSLRMRLLPTLS